MYQLSAGQCVLELLRLHRPSDRLGKKVATIIADNGLQAGKDFLKGYWYGVGVNDYEAIDQVASILGLNVRIGDLS